MQDVRFKFSYKSENLKYTAANYSNFTSKKEINIKTHMTILHYSLSLLMIKISITN